MLTSVSDYHIYLKLGKSREQALRDYLGIVEQALEWGIGAALPLRISPAPISMASACPLRQN